MLQLRCTGKAREELGIKTSELVVPKTADTLLGNWYINLFTVDRRKAFIFVNEKTLLSFIMFGVKKSNIKKTPEAFLYGLEQLLTIEGIELGKIHKIFDGYDTYEYTKTESKSLLGNVNDLVALYKHSILYEGGFKYIDIGRLIMKINRTPQRNLGWVYSIDLVKELLGETQKNAT